MLFLFAGPVISNTTYYSILAVAFLVIGVVLAAVLFIVKRLLNNNKSSASAKKMSIQKSFLIAIGTLAVTILMFLVTPTVLSDYRWNKKQSDCAIQAGYSSPSDDNNPRIATASTQSAYRSCLDKK